MRIMMLTNTYLPHVGGVANSVDRFARQLEAKGHEVHIVAPDYPGQERDEERVTRTPAIQRFNSTDFSVRLPIPGLLSRTIEQFGPDVIHSHHPFLLGDTALRIASWRQLPMVFTHHTRYEDYLHYVPFDAPRLRDVVKNIAVEYGNLCDIVIAPSESIAEEQARQGLESPTRVVPTGVDYEAFAEGDGRAGRRRAGIAMDGKVIGHVGRLAREKNLIFLSQAVGRVLQQRRDVRFLIVGSGPATDEMNDEFRLMNVQKQVVFTGALEGQELVDAYHAMDVFVFASRTETQGMVLTEAMAGGTPVVALDAPGAREVVRDGENGRLVSEQRQVSFVDATVDVLDADAERRDSLRRAARETAKRFSMEHCAERLIEVYREAIDMHETAGKRDTGTWSRLLNQVEQEWRLWTSRIDATSSALQ